MKQRLAGLLALVLCMLVLLAPVNGAMAAVSPSGVNTVSIGQGWLIENGKTVDINGGDNLSFYVNGTQKHSASNENNKEVSFRGVTTDYWYVVAKTEYFGRYFHNLEPTGSEVKVVGQPDNIKVFDRVIPIGSYSGNNFTSAQTIMDAFEKIANGRPLSIYEVVHVDPVKIGTGETISGFYQPNNQSGITFYLPKPAGTDIQVLHYTGGKVEEINKQNVSDEGDKLKIDVNSLSPFAVVYTPYPVPGASASTPPQTGDESRLMLWFALAGLSAAGLAVLTAKRRKRT